MEFEHLYISLPWIILAVAVFITLFFVSAPYGRHTKRKFGPSMNSAMAWVVMEFPAPLLFAALFLFGGSVSLTQIIFLCAWEAHYIHRAFVYPFTMRTDLRSFPLLIVASGFTFNLINAFLNGSYIVMHAGQYQLAWMSDIRFISGIALFIIGYIINRQSDAILNRIRRNSNNDYAIPNGGAFKWVSCPNYLGEIIIWIGWALATWSFVTAAFAIWTIANLAPRARAHHRWYREKFPEYPPERHALLPGIW
jgi:3-oxo-5-alpha-steroid 4-dehydrogenase 1